MSDVSKSAYGEPDQDSALAEALNQATSSSEVLAIMQKFKAESLAPNGAKLFVRDVYDESVLLPNPEAADSAAPARWATTVLNPRTGTKQIFESSVSEADALRQSNEWMRQQFQGDSAEPARDERGRYQASDTLAEQQRRDAQEQQELVRRSELELQFKRGSISAKDYLEQSGAIASYLAEQGVPLDDLRASVQEKQGERYTQSWASATETFKSNHPDWQGGEQNKNLIASLILENHWEDEDPLQAMEAAYRLAQEQGRITESVESRIANANSPEEIREAMGRNSSSLFGR